MKSFDYKTLSQEQKKKLLRRPKIDFTSIFETVQPILDEVREKGDEAVAAYTRQFDGVSADRITLKPSELDVELDEETKNSIDLAFANIEKFHRAQQLKPLRVETMPGVVCSRVTRAIERVGLYVPGGTAVLPSTAMMLAVPAMIAGCKQVVLATPPDKEGSLAPEILYIAQKANVDTILLAGGAQAVAAMAYGTESVPKTDKIFGPGNQYVTAAKMLLQNSEAQVSIDMPAGPSEVLVIADKHAKPAYVAADLLSQAEHGSDSQVVLTAIEGFNLPQLQLELKNQLDVLPRKDVAEKALNHSFIIKVNTIQEAFDFSNAYAPEHLIVNIHDAESFTDNIEHAGSVFLGPWTPESVGDYASGTNHTLPTYGYARMYSGVSLGSFQKTITMQQLGPEGLKNIGPAVARLAAVEKLEAHKNAVRIRLKDLNEG